MNECVFIRYRIICHESLYLNKHLPGVHDLKSCLLIYLPNNSLLCEQNSMKILQLDLKVNKGNMDKTKKTSGYLNYKFNKKVPNFIYNRSIIFIYSFMLKESVYCPSLTKRSSCFIFVRTWKVLSALCLVDVSVPCLTI